MDVIHPRIAALALMLLIAGLVPIASAIPAARQYGFASISAPAVQLSNNTGDITKIQVVTTLGNGTVTVGGPAIVANSTLGSAKTAAAYAARYLGLNYSNFNFAYTILNAGGNVSGPSGGAAMTIITISALSKHPMLSNFTMTGTIASNGSIGAIGGVYDKSGAAKAAGLSFILVPYDPEDQSLYVLTQGTYGIPLIQVQNITQAWAIASGATPANASGSQPIPYQNLSVGSIAPARLVCSNDCNSTPFQELANFTMNMTSAQIGVVSNTGRFPVVASQMQSALSQYAALVKKGYLYAGADLAFIEYINAYYFSNYNTTLNLTTTQINNIGALCNYGTPQLTTANYEYVLGGELRQGWGTYNINQTANVFATSPELTTDDALGALQQASTSLAWCKAAGKLYGLGSTMGGQNVVPSANLSIVANARVSQAQQYGAGIYTGTAQQALAANDFAVAILDADYQIATTNASRGGGQLTSVLLNVSNSISRNSTYGVWATQFANEAQLYIQEAKLTQNGTLAHYYAVEAYTAALLAQSLSSDTKLIYQNLVPGNATLAEQPVSAGNPALLLVLLQVMELALILVLGAMVLKLSAKVKELQAGAKAKSAARKRRNRKRS